MHIRPERFVVAGFLAVVVALVAVAIAGGPDAPVASVGFFGVAALWVGARLLRPRRGERPQDTPRALLERRLAAGEIGPEEYFEREAILRSGAPLPPPRRRLRSAS
ncbi:MAG: hypothetical protein M3N17_06640 [Actinomycetota bacterium]|nr:hypothetical protein [Actinomycetota bacterium]